MSECFISEPSLHGQKSGSMLLRILDIERHFPCIRYYKRTLSTLVDPMYTHLESFVDNKGSFSNLLTRN